MGFGWWGGGLGGGVGGGWIVLVTCSGPGWGVPCPCPGQGWGMGRVGAGSCRVGNLPYPGPALDGCEEQGRGSGQGVWSG